MSLEGRASATRPRTARAISSTMSRSSVKTMSDENSPIVVRPIHASRSDHSSSRAAPREHSERHHQARRQQRQPADDVADRADRQRRQQTQTDVEVEERQQRDGVEEPAADAHAGSMGPCVPSSMPASCLNVAEDREPHRARDRLHARGASVAGSTAADSRRSGGRSPCSGPVPSKCIRESAARAQTPEGRALRAHMVLRSRFAEDRLAAAVGRGVTQYVILGAGFDTFAVRQPPWARGLRILEVDHAGTQELKRSHLARGRARRAAERRVRDHRLRARIAARRTAASRDLAGGSARSFPGSA